MSTLTIFIWIILGFVAMSFWEAYAEGKYPWASRSVGWKIKITKRFTCTGYHTFLLIMITFFLTLPLIINGWNTKLFGIILSAASLGLVVEDFLWYVVNPVYSFKKFNPKDANHYPWIGPVPVLYVIGIAISLFSWFFLWR